MGKIASFTFLFALASSAYFVVAAVVAILSKRAFLFPLGDTIRRRGITSFPVLFLAPPIWVAALFENDFSMAHIGHRSNRDLPVPAPAARRAARSQCQAIRVALIVLMLASFAAGQTLTGTVKNSTTGKPSAGDDVVLFKLGEGMEEAGRTQTDAEGRFSFKLEEAQRPHLVRAIHQGVTYHRMAAPATLSVAIEVYDVGKKVNGVSVIADIMRIQTLDGKISVTRDFGVRNASSPPRTQLNQGNLEFYIPEGAQFIENSGTAIPENGAPVKSAPLPETEKNRYSFDFPLRPGLTRFEVTYQVPYRGSANLDPRSIYPLEHFMVMLPKSMQFNAASASTGFKMIPLPNVADATVQAAANTTERQNLAFNISGQGTLKTARQSRIQGPDRREGSSSGGAPAARSGNRPGGGLGAPIAAPDPLQRYRWWILGGSAALLIIGGVYVASRQQSRMRAYRRPKVNPSLLTAMQEEARYASTGAGMLEGTRPPAAARATSVLITGIKEELFRIEVERKQGQISQTEFERVKAALDQTLDRALKRKVRKAPNKLATL
jgi:hypothetical protein